MTTESYVQLPVDTSNTGKKQRTVERVVGANTVHETVVIPTYSHDILGLYYGSSDPIMALQTAHSATDGFCYLVNPIGSGISVALRRVKVVTFPNSLTGRTTTPIIRLERASFTGNPVGSIVVPAKRKSTDATNKGTMRLENTGMVVTAGAIIRRYIIPLVPTDAKMVNNPIDYLWEPLGEEGEMILTEGEGIVLRQQTDGNSGEDRGLIFDVTWLEY